MKISKFKNIRFERNRSVIYISVILLALVSILAIFWFFHNAPPNNLIITAGPENSSLWHFAEEYQKILKRSGVKLTILSSDGSVENLKRLSDLSNTVDIGFVQGGIQNSNTGNLVSLGSITYEPIYIFYRNPAPLDFISDFKGKRLAVGEPGSGTLKFSQLLLSNNGIVTGGSTAFLETDSDEAVTDLLKGNIDAVFLMGDSASSAKINFLLKDPAIHLYSFKQADAYTRHINYLHKIVLPMGCFDYAKNIPPSDINLIGPAIQIIARKSLHPALSDLILQAAEEVHSKPGLLKQRGEFPAPMVIDIKISSDAKRYYKSGEGFLYKIFPFWLASLFDRILFLILPLIVLFPSIIRGVPAFFQWRIKTRIYRFYRQLLNIEHNVRINRPGELTLLYEELDSIEDQVNKNVPVSFAESFYILREHIDFVRERIKHISK